MHYFREKIEGIMAEVPFDVWDEIIWMHPARILDPDPMSVPEAYTYDQYWPIQKTDPGVLEDMVDLTEMFLAPNGTISIKVEGGNPAKWHGHSATSINHCFIPWSIIFGPHRTNVIVDGLANSEQYQRAAYATYFKCNLCPDIVPEESPGVFNDNLCDTVYCNARYLHRVGQLSDQQIYLTMQKRNTRIVLWKSGHLENQFSNPGFDELDYCLIAREILGVDVSIMNGDLDDYRKLYGTR